MKPQMKSHEAYLAYVRALAKQWPFEPLGVYQQCYFYQSPNGTVRALYAQDFDRAGIWRLFERRTDLLKTFWPSASGADWDEIRASENLMSAAAIKGLVDPEKLGFEWDRGPPEGPVVALDRMLEQAGKSDEPPEAA